MALAVALACSVCAAAPGFKAEYVGGTIAAIAPKTNVRADFTSGDTLLVIHGKESLRIPCRKVTTLEYGQNVSRRVIEAVLISPLMLLSKSRKHYVTLTYTDEEQRPQVLVLRVGKGDIRAALAALEARTGRRVEYQDDNARKSGR